MGLYAECKRGMASPQSVLAHVSAQIHGQNMWAQTWRQKSCRPQLNEAMMTKENCPGQQWTKIRLNFELRFFFLKEDGSRNHLTNSKLETFAILGHH